MRKFLLVSAVLAVLNARADVRLPALFSDHMILQRDVPIQVWGWADDGEQVQVSFRNRTQVTTARGGRWQLTLGSFAANASPEVLTVSGRNKIELKDVLVGEVWIASGQSNMEWPLKRSAHAELAGLNLPPNIRHFNVRKARSSTPVADVTGAWTPATRESIPDFSAVAFYFSRDLAHDLKIPIGVIHTSWGGSPAEVWMSAPVLAANPDYKRDIVDAFQTVKARNAEAVAAWEKEKAEAEKAGRSFTKGRPGVGWEPSELYNAMIAPLIPYAIRGAIWYQGESNAGRAYQYRTLFADMIENWRAAWGLGQFPFLQVQLAPWDKNKKRTLAQITAEPVESDWAELREAQSLVTRTLPNVGMAVITDAGDKDDIHPTRKEPVGVRLALAARHIAYGEWLNLKTWSGPVYRSMKIRKNGEVELSFDHTDGGLMVVGGTPVTNAAGVRTWSVDTGKMVVPLTGFAVAGADRKFHWANARLDGDRVVVSCPGVTAPVAVRFGWADYPVVNLFNGWGLPASPFRTDDWPGVTWPKK